MERPETIRPADLLPCPFCGGGEWREEERRLPPRMDGKTSALISFVLRHWCARLNGVTADHREIRARDRESAVRQWNQRKEEFVLPLRYAAMEPAKHG